LELTRERKEQVMKSALKFAGFLLLCILLGMSLLSCNKIIDDDEQDVIGDAISLYRLTLSGASTQVGLVTVPFLKDDRRVPFVSVCCDFNGDGTDTSYSVDDETQEELIVKDVPILITQTSYSFYFSLVDTSITSGSSVKVKVLASQVTVYAPGAGGNAPPPTRVSLEKTVTVQILDTEDNATPEEGYIGSGGAGGDQRVGFVSQQTPPRDDIDEGHYFYRPDMPDTPQARNTCVAHSIANSLAWLARKHAFADSFKTPLHDYIGPYDIDTPDGMIMLGWDVNNTYDDRGSFDFAKGVKKGDVLPGKKEFVQQKKLPIETTRMPQDTSDYSGTGVFEFIIQALREGCDVEVSFRIPAKKGGHMGTVVGFTDYELGGKHYRSLLIHDPLTKSYDDLHQINEDGVTIEKFPFAGGLHTAKIAFAFKECYKPTQVGCTEFSGTYYCSVTEMDDPGNHYQFVGDPFQQPLDFVISDPSISATGQAPFVDVTGTIDEGCSFTANGSGTVAGYANVTVQMSGAFADGAVDGSYSMGVGGELPGGEAITFYFSGYRR
jgi:hypothetical protein